MATQEEEEEEASIPGREADGWPNWIDRLLASTQHTESRRKQWSPQQALCTLNAAHFNIRSSNVMHSLIHHYIQN